MKKYYIFLLACLSLIGLASCSDEVDNPYAHTPSLSIVSQDLTFSAASATKTFGVNAPDGITKVSTSMDWCTATIEGTNIKVTVAANGNKESRSSRVTVWSGADSVYVVVQQMGTIFTTGGKNEIILDDFAATRSIDLWHNVTPTLATTADWMTAEMKDGKLVLTTTDNNTGKIRAGYIKFTVGSVVDSILVMQRDFKKDILGQYYVVFKDKPTDTKYSATEATLTETELQFTTDNLTLPITSDEKDFSISIKSGRYLGSFVSEGKTYYIYNIFYDKKGEYWTSFNTNYTGKVSFSYDKTLGTYGALGGTFEDYTIGCLSLEAFKSRSFTKSAHAGELQKMYNMTLVKR